MLLFDTHTNKKKYQTGRTTLPLPHSTQHLVIQELNSIKSPLLLTNTLSSISTTIVSQKNMSIETSKKLFIPPSSLLTCHSLATIPNIHLTHNHYFDTTNSLTINLTPSLLKPYPYLLPAHFHEKNHRTITPKSNVKAKPKHPASPPPPPPPKTPEWKTITTQKGDSLSRIFNRMQLNQTLLGKIIQKNPYAHDLKSIKPNEKIQFLFNKQKEVEKIIIPITITRQLAIYSSKWSIYY